MSDPCQHENVPQALWEGEFKLFGVRLWCYVLDDENHTRIVNAEDVALLFDQMEQTSHPHDLDLYELRRFAMWQKD